MQLRFCPACGIRLAQGSTVRYCSGCGENLAALAAPEPVRAEPAAGPVKTMAEVARRYDQFLIDLKGQGLPEEEIRRQAAAMFTALKAELPPRPATVAARSLPAAAVQAAVEDHYSVVLKTSGDKERLTNRLGAVLRRGAMATRMAVDMVPCVILYKSKAADIQGAVAIFEDEQVHYTIVEGDFAADAPAETVIPGFFDLSWELQQLFRDTPTVLWLGEKIHLAVPAAELEGEQGALVATDRGLYFSGRLGGGADAEWRIIPYRRLAEAVLDDGRDGALELVYKGNGRAEWLRIADQDQLEQVYGLVRSALARPGR